jgi:hypothetical protein
MLVPYKHWLLAKKRRANGSWDRDMRPQSTDCMSLNDVIHSAEFDAELLGIIMNQEGKPPIRHKAVLCDVNIVDTSGNPPKGEKSNGDA